MRDKLGPLNCVKQKGRITNKDYQTLNNISREMATIDLRKLVEMNILRHK